MSHHAHRILARGLGVLLITAGSLGTVGCRGGKGPADPSALHHSLPPVAVDDAGFAPSVHQLLKDGRATPERSALLAGTVQRQMTHAASLFERGEKERGADAVVGALYLVRAGEARPDMFGADGADALSGAMERFSALGDDGRAMALILTQRALVSADSARGAELDEHRRAVKQWLADTRPTTAMGRLGAAKRAAVALAMLSPSDQSLVKAEKAVNAWVARAVEINLDYQRTRKAPRRDVIVEAYRALQLGSETMAAIFLRNGRAQKAVVALDGGAAGRVADAQFFARLDAAAQADSAEDWRLLAKSFRQRALDDEEVKMDERLLDAVMWNLALEAYRRDRSSYRVAFVLAAHLAHYGMPEVAPLVLSDALGREPTTVALNGVLRNVKRGLSEQRALEDVQTARRIFDASAAILKMADRPRYRGRTKPSSSALRMLMADIELRGGDAERAVALMAAAMKASASADGYLRLAKLHRQLGQQQQALARAQAAIATARDSGGKGGTRGKGGGGGNAEISLRARLLVADLMADAGDDTGAKKAAEAAFAEAQAFAKAASSTSQGVAATLLLAQAHDARGQFAEGTATIVKAVELTREGDPALFGRVLLMAMRRAVVRSDVHRARATLQRGLGGHLDPDIIVRAALWLSLLEKELGETPDGKAERVLVDAADGDLWWNVAARWARDLASDDELRAASRRHGDRLRADFYIAMRSRAANPNDGQALERVARDPMYWEAEVALARSFLSSRGKRAKAAAPAPDSDS